MPGLLQPLNTYREHANGAGSQPIEVPVLIVGGGPTGLLTAYMLSKFGVKSLLIEKYPTRLAAPKAHALCPRSFEICRQFGLDTNAMRLLGSPRKDAFRVNFVTNLSGDSIGSLPYERMDSAVLDATPEMIHNIPQPDFEEFIAEELKDDDNVEIHKSVAFLSCEQNGDEVISTIEERSTSHQWRVKSRHVIACDGAKSQVRKHLGIESEGEDGYETMMTIHFNADLRPVVGDRVGMLHWITDPACSGFIIAYDLGGNQVLISNFDSKKHPAETWNHELAKNTVAAAIGQDIPFNVLSCRPWVLSRKVAKHYSQGNVHLVGDAAHSFPPTGGLGLNSGIADAHNIAYKVAAVHNNWANPSILETYHTDRRPIALISSAQSVKNGKKIFSFLKTLGTAGISDVEQARANLLRSIHDPAKQDMIAEEIEGQREHFDNLEIHIGYVYDGSTKVRHASQFTPKFVPGARLAHAWIKPRKADIAQGRGPINVAYIEEFNASDIFARQYSTLDLIGIGSFTLIVHDQVSWAQRFEEITRLLRNTSVDIRLRSLRTDFTFVYQAQKNIFEEGARLSQGGAILVRPDQHLLGCPVPDSTAESVASLVAKHVGKSL